MCAVRAARVKTTFQLLIYTCFPLAALFLLFLPRLTLFTKKAKSNCEFGTKTLQKTDNLAKAGGFWLLFIFCLQLLVDNATEVLVYHKSRHPPKNSL